VQPSRLRQVHGLICHRAFVPRCAAAPALAGRERNAAPRRASLRDRDAAAAALSGPHSRGRRVFVQPPIRQVPATSPPPRSGRRLDLRRRRSSR
jgi:hypothetical protein